jgi:hypothetical protein
MAGRSITHFSPSTYAVLKLKMTSTKKRKDTACSRDPNIPVAGASKQILYGTEIAE